MEGSSYTMPFIAKHQGDHIFVKKRLGGVAPYEHHGIYVGGNKVIHVVRSNSDGKACIMETDLVEFADQSIGEIQELVYSPKFEPNEIVQRAIKFCEPNAFSQYNLTASNCEHFAQFCRLGEWNSDQVNKILSPLGLLDNVNVDAQLARNSLKTMISRGGNLKTKVGFFVGAIALKGLDWFHDNQQSLEKEAELYGNSRVDDVPPALADINKHLRRNQVG